MSKETPLKTERLSRKATYKTKAVFILLVFSLMNFAIEMTASVFNGILDRIAISLDVSIAQAGLLNSMYFYGAALGVLFSPLIDLEKILLSAIIQIRGKFHDKKGLHSRIQRTDIKGIPGGWECFACR